MDEKLWSDDPAERLQAAQALRDCELDKIHEELRHNFPYYKETKWPYGCTTTINPMILTIAGSPGTSPASLDFGYRNRFSLPTAGEPHPHIHYQDDGDYWNKIRELALTLLGYQEEKNKFHLLSLFGNVNLAMESNPETSSVQADPNFVEWLLRNIKNTLRPRLVVCVGLVEYFDDNPEVNQKFIEVFGIDMTKPYNKYHFKCSGTKRNLIFREWEDKKLPNGNNIKFITWPQSPVKPPMKTKGVWSATCNEFVRQYSKYLPRFS